MKTYTKYTKQLKMLPIKLMGCGILCLTINPVSSLAQDMPANEVYELDEFVVTDQFLFSDQVNALKTPTPVIDVPQSLSITSAADISLRGFDSVGDIVEYTPGVNVNQGEGHRDAVVFRGVGTTSDFFVDGARDDVQYYRPLYNIEQVEILRGPNALLFGRGGAGGVINRVTKKAEIGQDSNAYSLSLNTFGASEVQFDKNVAIDENTAFRINAYFNTFENHRDYSDGSGYGVNPTFKFVLSDKTTLDVSVEAIDYDRSIDRGIPSVDGKPVDALNDIVFGDPDFNKSEFEMLAYRALLQHSFSDTLKGIFSASYTDYDKLYKNWYAKKYDGADEITFDGYIDTTKRQNFVLSGNLVAEFEQGDVNHTVLFGAEILQSSSENDRYINDFDPTTEVDSTTKLGIDARNTAGTGFNAGGLVSPFDVVKDDSTSDVDVLSLYVQDEIKLSDNLTALIGVRYDKYDIDSVNRKSNNAKSDDSASEVTPRLGLIYKPQEDVSVYASYSQTFLPASGDQFATVGGGADFDPNEYTNLEAGVKLNLAAGFNVTAAVFQVDANVVQENSNDVYQRFDNEIEGFELQVVRKVSDQWTVSAGYTKLDGDDTNTGKRVAELPKSTFTIWNNFQLSDRLGLGLGAIYQGESSPKGGPDYGIVPSFTRVDAAAYYQLSDNLRLQVNVENLLDTTYYPHAYDDHQFTVGAPINATVSIKGTF